MSNDEPFYKGEYFAIYSILNNGKSLVKEFIEEELNDIDSKKIILLLKRTAENGLPHNKQKFRHLEDKIYEFKSYQVRILCFLEEGYKIILIHGFIKKGDKTPKREIEKAQRLYKLYRGSKGD